MSDSKYMLTNDFRILYCPNIKLKLSCKELNYETMDFFKYDGDLNLIESFIELDANDIDIIINDLFNTVIGIELPKGDMDWLSNFDNILEDDKSIIYDKSLAFNYSVLKLRLVGFPEEMALKITSTQFINQQLIKNYPDHTIFIDKINEILDRRKFWISNKTKNYSLIETNYLRTVFEYKNKLKYQFDFKSFNDRYLNVIENSFIPHLMEFNSQNSYLIRNPLNIKEQEKYLIESYKFVIIEITNELLKKEFPNLLTNEIFLKDLINELISTVKLYLNIIIEKEA